MRSRGISEILRTVVNGMTEPVHHIETATSLPRLQTVSLGRPLVGVGFAETISAIEGDAKPCNPAKLNVTSRGGLGKMCWLSPRSSAG